MFEQKIGVIVKNEASRKSKRFLPSGMTLAFLATFAFSLSMSQDFYTHPAQAADEPNITASENRSFTQLRLLRTLTGHTGTIKSLNFSPNSKMLVSGGSDYEPTIRFWHPQNGKKLGTINRAHQGAIDSILITPDGKTLISCGSDYRINFWNLRTLEFSRAFDGHTTSVLSLALTPDSQILASGGLDGIRLWDLQNKLPLATLASFDNAIYSLAISPNSQILASGDNKGIIKLWDIQSRKLITQFNAHSEIITRLVFTPDGQTLVSSSRDKTIKIWNINNGQQIRTLKGHNNWVNTIAISPDGNTLASGGQDGMKLWDLTTGELKNISPENSNSVMAWTQPITEIAFSSDGKMIATGGVDQKINIWLNQ